MATLLIIERAFCVRREGAGAGSYTVLFTHLHVHVLGQVRPSFRMLVSPTDNRLLFYHSLFVEIPSFHRASPEHALYHGTEKMHHRHPLHPFLPG